MIKSEINIVWFKRDLRLQDHEPLAESANSRLPTLLLYIFEPELVNSNHYDLRHWRFVWESLKDLQQELDKLDLHITIVFNDPVYVFSKIRQQFDIHKIFSHQETGIDLTFQRDKRINDWCLKEQVIWKEFPTNAVHRGLMHRDGWNEKWKQRIQSDLIYTDLKKIDGISLPDSMDPVLNKQEIPPSWNKPDSNFQHGGIKAAHRCLESFLGERVAHYNQSISKPAASRTGCSRLSPYITWGNLSLKQVHKAFRDTYSTSEVKWQLRSFENRLKWHCHFIQKFESEPRIEFENINRGFNDIRKEWNEEHFQAWKNGNTGFPLIDACMRAVIETGYINFRMRAMLVSFLTHNLWLQWQKGAIHLGQQFLDFEPGIHYPQFQMQAATTGTNSIRIYNPVKQSYDHDPDGNFIKEWVPELQEVPSNQIHEPWKLSLMEQKMYSCVIGEDYPEPVIKNLKESYNRAQQILWNKKKEKKVQQENRRILKKHVKN